MVGFRSSGLRGWRDRQRKGREPPSVNPHVRSVKAALNYAVEHRHLETVVPKYQLDRKSALRSARRRGSGSEQSSSTARTGWPRSVHLSWAGRSGCDPARPAAPQAQVQRAPGARHVSHRRSAADVRLDRIQPPDPIQGFNFVTFDAPARRRWQRCRYPRTYARNFSHMGLVVFKRGTMTGTITSLRRSWRSKSGQSS